MISHESPAQPEHADHPPLRSTRQLSPWTYVIPQHYEPEYAYPLIVFLHGQGENEHQIDDVVASISLRNYVCLGVRGTQAQDPLQNPNGFQWVHTPVQTASATQRVFDAIDDAKTQFKISDERIFLVGVGVGGSMAIRIGLSHPRRFAGVVSMEGSFPTGNSPLMQLEAARQLPILLLCGRESTFVTQDRVCETVCLCHAAGMHLDVRLYPGCDQHASLMFADVNRWIMTRIAEGNPGAVSL